MISSFVFIILGWLGILSEATWMQTISVGGVLPDLSIILVVAFSMQLGSRKGRIVGLILGLIQDLLFSSSVGFYALILYLIGHFAGFFSKDISHVTFVWFILILTVCDLAAGVLQYIGYGLLKGDFHFGYALIHVILPETIYSLLMAVPLYLIYRIIIRGTMTLDQYTDRFITPDQSE